MTLKQFLKFTATRWGISETKLKWAAEAYRKYTIGYGALGSMLSKISNKNISGNMVRKFIKKLKKFPDWIT